MPVDHRSTSPLSRLLLVGLVLAAPTAVPAAVQTSPLERLIAELTPAFVMVAGGSGVVISADGLLLTNHHVIEAHYSRGRTRFQVRVGDTFADADLLGTDPRGDIALLRLRDGDDHPFVPLGDSDALRLGQGVIAIGNPFGAMEVTHDPSVSVGVVSCLHRYQGGYSDAIQTDAPVNPGNSGGPLITLDGELIGINGQIRTKHGGRSNTGIGLAIPSNQIRRFLDPLCEADGGVVLHAHLDGLVMDRDEADGIQNGAELAAVRDGSLAATAGLRPGDRIVAVDQLPVLNAGRLYGIIGTYPAGVAVTMTVQRDDERQTLAVTLGSYDPGRFGFTIAWPEDKQERRKLSRRIQRDPEVDVPVRIATLVEDPALSDSGLLVGDRIITIAETDIRNPRDIELARRDLIRNDRLWAGRSVPITILRGEDDQQERQTLAMPLLSTYRRTALDADD